MNPVIEQDFRPPPQPGLSRGLLPAIMVHVLLIAALAWGVQWRLGASHEIAAAAPEQSALAQHAGPGTSSSRTGQDPAASAGVATARMGESPASTPALEERQSASDRPSEVAAQIPQIPQIPQKIPARGKNAKVRSAPVFSAPQRAASPKPSFDCAKARSFAERTICADAELAQLDRDLGRLHARAKRSATDPAAFRRQNDAEWRRREKTCRDRNCLLRWYADRRQQLTGSLNQASLRTDRTAAR